MTRPSILLMQIPARASYLALRHRPLYSIFVFDGRRIAFTETVTRNPKTNELKRIATGAEALAQAKPRIIGHYRDLTMQVSANGLTSLAPLVAKIAAETSSPEIRELSKECLAALGE